MNARGMSAVLMLIAGTLQIYIALAPDVAPDLRRAVTLVAAAAWLAFAAVTWRRYRHG